MPRYPIYVISKGRWETPLTARFLIKDRVPFSMVVEPQEADAYRLSLPGVKIHTLPFSNLGQGGIPARNWVWEHSKSEGHERHWILDDNIYYMYRRFKAKRIICNSEVGFKCAEDFADRYENVALLAINYKHFVPDGVPVPPFYVNHRCYSCILINNSLPQRWRGRYNEDTDLTLQVLTAGWCTLLINAFLVDKVATMKMKGGNSDQLYKGDGRLRMARALERMWPGVVETKRRFKRPQHVVHDEWRCFDNQLKLKPGIDLEKLSKTDEYGMKAVEVKPIKSEYLKEILKDQLCRK
jgi:hypothetical protein